VLNYVGHQFVTGVPRAVAVWSALVVLSAATMLTLAGSPWRERALRSWVRMTARRMRRTRWHSETEQAHRRAEELTAAATRAGAEAEHGRERWRVACREVEAAWRAFDAADRAARDALYAAACACGDVRGVSGNGDAPDAHRYGEAADRPLTDALAGRDGWDPGRHPAVLAAARRSAVRADRWQRLLTAQAREREAWEAADAASARRVALAREAARAQLDAARRSMRPRPLPVVPAPAPGLGLLSRPAVN
jgi:hypothetical protein